MIGRYTDSLSTYDFSCSLIIQGSLLDIISWCAVINIYFSIADLKIK